MKKLLFIAIMAMVAFASTTFVSCGSDDDATGNTADNKPSYNVNFMVLGTSDQVKYYDMSYTISVNGKDTVVSVSGMTQLTDSNLYKNISVYKSALQINDAFDQFGKIETINVYSANLGLFKSGKFAVKNIKYSVKNNTPTDKTEIGIISAIGFYSDAKDYKENKTDAQLYKGISTEKDTLVQFAGTMAEGNDAITFEF